MTNVHFLKLLTMIVNSFYEAQMVLLDNIVSKALELKKDRVGSSLEVSDFAFGFGMFFQLVVGSILNLSSQILK